MYAFAYAYQVNCTFVFSSFLHVCVYLCVFAVERVRLSEQRAPRANLTQIILILTAFFSVPPSNSTLKASFGAAFPSDTFSVFSRTVWLCFCRYFLLFSLSSSHHSGVSPHIYCLFDFPGAFPVSFSRFSARSLLVPRLLL